MNFVILTKLIDLAPVLISFFTNFRFSEKEDSAGELLGIKFSTRANFSDQTLFLGILIAKLVTLWTTKNV